MARLEGILKKLKGSAGSLTFKQVNRQTVVSEKATTVKNTRSSGQQRQRTKWSNVVMVYKGITPLINGGFEQKTPRCNDFQMFMKVNMPNSDIYLTKQEVEGGGCIAAAYQITQGTLPSIETSGSGDNVRTNIKLGDLTIDENTTVKEFAKAVVDNNVDYNYDDQIAFFDVLQCVNSLTGIPYCQFFGTNVVLDKTSDVKLLELVSKYGFATVDGFLGHIEGEGAGVFAWVHSRKVNGKTLVSTQFLVNNNTDIIAEYSGNEAYKRSVKTYGGEKTNFLTPGSTTTSSNNGTTDSTGGSTGGNTESPDESGSDPGSGSGTDPDFE